MTTALEKRKQVDEAAAKLDTVVTDRMAAIAAAKSPFAKALAVGRAYLDIKAELTTQMDFVVALAGQANGFKCDKDYDAAKIKQCAVDALIAGCSLIGNEWNIIGGNMYIAQNGWRSKLRQIPGFSFVGVPRFKAPAGGPGFVEVECEQTYLIDDEELAFPFKAFVRTNSASNIDNNLGKAKAKLWRALFESITGEFWAESGEVDTDTRPTAAKSTLSLQTVTETVGNSELPPVETAKPVAEAKPEAVEPEPPKSEGAPKKTDLVALLKELDAAGGDSAAFLQKQGVTLETLKGARAKMYDAYLRALRLAIATAEEAKKLGSDRTNIDALAE